MAPRDCLQPDLPHLPLLLHRHSHRARLLGEPRRTDWVRGRPRWLHERWRGRRGPALSLLAEEVLRHGAPGANRGHAHWVHYLRPRGAREHVVAAPGRPRDWRPWGLVVSGDDLPQRGHREEAQEQRHIHRPRGLAKPWLRLGSSLCCRSRLRRLPHGRAHDRQAQQSWLLRCPPLRGSAGRCELELPQGGVRADGQEQDEREASSIDVGRSDRGQVQEREGHAPAHTLLVRGERFGGESPWRWSLAILLFFQSDTRLLFHRSARS